MKIVAIVQARMTSTRLPGKVLKKVLNKTLLEYQLERISRSKYINEIVVATTTNESDEPIVELCENLNYSIFRGSEDDVLSRYYNAAIESKADVIVRLTSDCPLIDAEVIDQVIKKYNDELEEYDYVSNTLIRTFPRGFDTEVFSIKALEIAFLNAKHDFEHEHVTSYIYSNPKLFNLKNVTNQTDLSDNRWTIDTVEDFRLISKILNNLYRVKPNFLFKDIIEIVNKNPNWSKINEMVEQKSSNSNAK